MPVIIHSLTNPVYAAKAVARWTGILTLLCSVYGLVLSFMALAKALEGGFSELIQQYSVPYFYPSFYSMLGITILCCLLLAWCGFDQVRLNLQHLRLFVWIFVFEIAYFSLIGGILWRSAEFGLSVAAGSGVANKGLMPQFYLLLPLWAPITLSWAKKRLRTGN